MCQFANHVPHSNRNWPLAGEADSVSSVSATACHIGGPNSFNTGQILLVYGILNQGRAREIEVWTDTLNEI